LHRIQTLFLMFFFLLLLSSNPRKKTPQSANLIAAPSPRANPNLCSFTESLANTCSARTTARRAFLLVLLLLSNDGARNPKKGWWCVCFLWYNNHLHTYLIYTYLPPTDLSTYLPTRVVKAKMGEHLLGIKLGLPLASFLPSWLIQRGALRLGFSFNIIWLIIFYLMEKFTIVFE
jgi:hypothetical protein